jgi:hypothetical protein
MKRTRHNTPKWEVIFKTKKSADITLDKIYMHSPSSTFWQRTEHMILDRFAHDHFETDYDSLVSGPVEAPYWVYESPINPGGSITIYAWYEPSLSTRWHHHDVIEHTVDGETTTYVVIESHCLPEEYPIETTDGETVYYDNSYSHFYILLDVDDVLAYWRDNDYLELNEATTAAILDHLTKDYEGPLGSISQATMRNQDLIPTFLETLIDMGKLDEIDTSHYDAMLSKYREYSSYNEDDIEVDPWWTGQQAYEFLDELFDILDMQAPKGYYFGAHPGDGSDYGFWPLYLQ